MSEADVTYVQMKDLQHSCSKFLGVMLNPITLEDALTPTSNLAGSIVYYNKDYWFHDSTHLKQQVRQHQEATQKLMVFLGGNTEYRGKNRYLHILIAGPA